MHLYGIRLLHIKILILVYENEEYHENCRGNSDIYVSHIEYREIYVNKIKKIYHIIKGEPVIKISYGSRAYHHQTDP